MILNTGSRTDIPAFFSSWFYKRIKDGYVNVRNPYYMNEVTKYKLDPKVVDCIVFCTKNPEPMIPRLDEIKDFGQIWFVTVTPYEKDIEPHVPAKESVIESFKKLSLKLGKEKVIWRYDPIFINDKYTLERHISDFEAMAENFSGYTSECIISFIDLYEKTKNNFRGVRRVNKEERFKIAEEFLKIGNKYNIKIKTCAEGRELESFGIDTGGCLTKEVIERAIGIGLKVPKVQQARNECGCLLGNDIGVYNTCAHGCLYCYANYNQELVRNNFKMHDESSSFLIGKELYGDVVKDAKQESFIDGQIGMFDI